MGKEVIEIGVPFGTTVKIVKEEPKNLIKIGDLSAKDCYKRPNGTVIYRISTKVTTYNKVGSINAKGSAFEENQDLMVLKVSFVEYVKSFINELAGDQE